MVPEGVFAWLITLIMREMEFSEASSTWETIVIQLRNSDHVVLDLGLIREIVLKMMQLDRVIDDDIHTRIYSVRRRCEAFYRES